MKMQFDVAALMESLQTRITDVCADSRRIAAIGGRAAFLAYPGGDDDGRKHIKDAINKGAAAVIWEPDGYAWQTNNLIPNAAVPGLRARVGEIADYVYRRPSAELFVAAITGTNGKTTTAWFAAQLLENAAVIGTLGAGKPGAKLINTTTTTPDVAEIHRLLRVFADDGKTAVMIEASSHGIVQTRLANVRLDCAALVSLGRDHLDYHGDLRAYWNAKKKLFAMPGLQSAIVNGNDKNCMALVADIKIPRQIFCRDDKAVYADNPSLRLQDGGIFLPPDKVESGSRRLDFAAPSFGGCNVDNMLAAFLIARSAGLSWRRILAKGKQLTLPPGHMQQVANNTIFVDYAHTPDALHSALQMAQGARKIVVFGCGGGRDSGKRPQMGAVVAQLADVAILSDDNPRSENPQTIRDAVAEGFYAEVKNSGRFCRLRIIPDRAKAIAAAVCEMDADDVVLVAGKGHEQYQQTHNGQMPFSDIAVATKALDNKKKHKGKPLTSALALMICGGDDNGEVPVALANVCIDTRQLQKGDMFVALPGANVDGHDFIGEAKKRGAAAAMAERKMPVDIPQVIVGSCADALRILARQWRNYFCGFDGALAAITGSNGKTTVKEMLAAICIAAAGEKFVHRSYGNQNNLLGLPLSLLRLHKHHRYAVIEAGMDAPGELRQLGFIAAPQVAVITNAQRAHLGGFESVAAIARAKGELLESAQTAVLNADSPFFDEWKKQCRDYVSFGFSNKAKVRGRTSEGGVYIDGIGDVALAVAGMHNAHNALAAAAAAQVLAIDKRAIVEGLQKFGGVAGRLQFRHITGGAVVIDDTYNANPDSMLAALAVLARQPGKQIAALGDMLALGKTAAAEHRNIAAAIPQGALLLTVGAMMKKAGGKHFNNKEQLAKAVREELQNCNGDVAVLVKGSRGMQMETIVEALVR